MLQRLRGHVYGVLLTLLISPRGSKVDVVNEVDVQLDCNPGITQGTFKDFRPTLMSSKRLIL